MLILISGLPGSGKTTLDSAFSAKTGAHHLNSDLLRQELGLMGHYDPKDKEKVYASLLDQTKTALTNGQHVVVDSTFYKESIREPFRQLAADCPVPVRWVEVCAQESTIRERLKNPRPDSEADYQIYEKIKNAAEPLSEPHLTLWSDTMPLQTMVDAITAYTNLQPTL
jgi:predicted kinase